ncbi:COMM domain containing 8, transcript variant X1 [Ictidomys tridecemlineatus]|uniref:COMM domain-containing protein 8 isoform X1 n=1 Tax=Ictidomys tridecemlineatus TaxID=43179 RepID=UPI000B53B033|nr:COMM domain-containing protein 8 isoform X1 [Ictidomys tridecemlineatus]XP_040148406.1 COMM domain-containing protein 8 isoform X1 [Ictidomys tridecemlineatus]KAG3276674.1 COMM domain containing 8, transcript variant X4 [Ictidomys tridecemlineatus]KAG3276675.1 COMM domain containing 8, transcript variant X2 [Ictidomys tridecemlineatus]KAG3276676.1 COMM domain containing 8, transcript variant X3 [Ictidomys tridecemlineatus]KAG3276677.1 COMM domain containing 8, transcript variant X1 [Ictidom
MLSTDGSLDSSALCLLVMANAFLVSACLATCSSLLSHKRRMKVWHLPLLHKIIDGFCGRAYPLYQDYHSVWDSTEWMNVLEDVTKFFKALVGKNLSDEETLQQLNHLNSSHQEAIMKCLKSRKNEIKQVLLREIVDISSAQLQDFDWQLKLALSSDKIATLQMPLLNLHLDVKENGEVKPYSVEMSKEELQNLINSLEAANKVVLQLK